MRQIKFRAWDKDSKHVYDLKALPVGELQRLNELGDPVMQFTGLLDKNGKEIYEDDVVEIDLVGKCRVVYLDHSMKFYFQTLEDFNGQFVASVDKINLIGNVYENPELLK